MNKKHFVTLFPSCPNFGLVKDVGQIPYTLAKSDKKFSTELVSCDLNLKGEFIDEVEGLKLTKIKKIINYPVAGMLYLFKHSKSIDCLNIYHYGRKTYLWNMIYKMINPKGYTYLKLDMDFIACDKLDKNKREIRKFNRYIEKMDLVSVESRDILERLKKYTKKDIIWIPNGFCEWPKSEIKIKKKNIFVTVGRLGTKQKATEILLEAFAKTSDMHDWELRLVGTIEKDFESYITDFYERNPLLKGRVFFVGNCTDRTILKKEYEQAKVFVLPSRWESFGLVIPEALSCGCRLILSDKVPIKNDVIADRGYEFKVDDINQLSEIMLNATNYCYSENEEKRIIEFAYSKYSWNMICKDISIYISKR